MTALTLRSVATPGTAAAGDPVPPVEEPSRRERKKLQTRHALRSHGLRLFAEQGFDATTVSDITEAADVAPRTFFLHYSSKEDLLLGDAGRSIAAFEALLREMPAGPPYAAVRTAALGALDVDETGREQYLLVARLMEGAPHLAGRVAERYAEYEALITAAVAERTGLDAQVDAYPRLVAACTMTAVRVGLGLWHARGGTGSVTDVVDELLDQLGEGLDHPAPQLSTRQG